MIPIHPEAVTGDPASLRWRVVTDVLPPPGVVAAAPGALGELIRSGEVAQVVVEANAVVVSLPGGASWRASGPRVRTALHTALAKPAAWVTVAPANAGSAAGGRRLDGGELTSAAVEAVLAGPAGETIRRHGGAVRVLGVHDGVADLELAGACAGCPASGLTIATTLTAVLRDEVGLREVRVTEAPSRPFVALSALLRRPRS